VIVGFPGETEQDFRETVEFVREARFLTVHIFPYSKRKGTPAAEMKDQIPEEIKRRRLHELEQVAAEIRREILEEEIRENSVTEVLLETYEKGYAHGHTADFLEVAIPLDAPMRAKLVKVRLERTDGKLCYGAAIDEKKL
jgi:threonylcarbamoyladenosine tRNA methylthiotransferase MtaB